MEAKLKHLEFIQNLIARTSGNSFILKGWSVTLIAALFALSAKDADRFYALLAYYPIIVFWILDGYFLSMERRFRALYDHVRRLPITEIDFSMETTGFTVYHHNTWRASIFSKTLLIHYGSLAVLLLVSILLLL
jgi:hypothetical protein